VADYVNGAVLYALRADTVRARRVLWGDFSEVKKPGFRQRALEIAAAGFHNVSWWGRPVPAKAAGQAFPADLLPGLSFEEKLETPKIYSASGC